MILRLTVHDPVTGDADTVEVIAEPESSVGSLIAELPLGSPGSRWFVGAEPLNPDATVAGSPLLPGAVLTLGRPGPSPRCLPPGAVGAVRVLDGTDAGQVRWLPPGEYLIARDPSAAVCLRDRDVSRRHARIEVGADGRAGLRDSGSVNGTLLGRRPVSGEPVPWQPGVPAEIGGDLLEWVPSGPPPPPPVRSRDARLDFDRAFAATPEATAVRIRLPDAVPDAVPDGSGGRVAAMVTAAVPLLLGAVLAAVMKQPTLLLMGLYGPLSWGVTAWTERRAGKARQARHRRDRAGTQRAIAAAVAAEERARRAGAPDLHDLTLAALGRGVGVWPRNADSPDGLLLRVGTGTRDAAIDLVGTPWEGMVTPRVRGVPVTLDLRAAGVLGVVGPPRAAAGLARWLLLQLATLRSPEDLRIVVITSGSDTSGSDNGLTWASWLPHCDGGADEAGVPSWFGNTDPTRRARVMELRDLVTRRLTASGDGERAGCAEEVVVLLDGALALRHLPGMKVVLREGPGVGVHTIAVDRTGMNEARAECAVDEDGTVRLRRSRTDLPVIAQAATVGVGHALQVARALAPLRDRLALSAAGTALPCAVRFLDLLGIDQPGAADVRERWNRRPGPCTEVVLGADAAGKVTVDLAAQGPHTMLAGATGAGKSALLQTLVTALLLANRPDELNLVLVDFKGGGAFLPFAGCPQVVSLIRSTGETAADLFDATAAARMLASVRAEVRRREALLARFGGEIDEYWRAGAGAGWRPLPRLVLVFDEFARVLETSPDFLQELVNVAAKGRSLGMHLVLATQSLQGKLSPELKNAIDLRITLRQNEPADSIEVLGVPDAAGIPGRLRGRGMILCTKEETRTPALFQAGYLGDAPPTGQAVPVRVRRLRPQELGEPRPEHRGGPSGQRTDQDLVIEAIERACAQLGLPAPWRPLLPPLPATLPLTELPARVTAPISPTAVPFGLLDDPNAQAQLAALLDLACTDRILAAGGPQSGRTTLAMALLAGLITRWRPDQVHVYVVEREPGGLAAFAAAPHCGGVVTPAEPDRIRRLVTWLAAETQRRAGARFAPGRGPDPWIVLVIDGWEHFENRGDPAFPQTSLPVTLREVIAAGPPLGVHVVPLGGQDLLNGTLPALFSRRVLLPFPVQELRRAHLPSGATSPPLLPGRAVDAATGLHLQVACPDVPAALASATGAGSGVGPGTGSADVMDDVGGGARARVRTGDPVRFPSLPVQLPLSRLPVAGSESSRTWIPLGVGGPAATPTGIDLFDAGPHLLLVSGAAGTGRTSTAATVVRGLRAAGVGVLLIVPPHSPLPDLLRDTGITDGGAGDTGITDGGAGDGGAGDRGVRVVRGTTVTDRELRQTAEAFGDARFAVIVDDCEQVTVVPTQKGWEEEPTLLAEIADPGSLGRRGLVLCGDALPILSGQRRCLARVVGEAMTSGTRLLLCPLVPAVAREHGLVLEPDQFFPGPAGRGYLVAGRATTLIQVADPTA